MEIVPPKYRGFNLVIKKTYSEVDLQKGAKILECLQDTSLGQLVGDVIK